MAGMPQWRDDGILLVGEIGIAADDGSEASCECCSHPTVIVDALLATWHLWSIFGESKRGQESLDTCTLGAKTVDVNESC